MTPEWIKTKNEKKTALWSQIADISSMSSRLPSCEMLHKQLSSFTHKIEAILLVLLSVGLHLARSTEPNSAGTSSLGYEPNITQSSIFPQNW